MSAPEEARRQRWFSLEEELRAFELEEWGTNRMPEIQQKIQKSNWQKAQDTLTGMDEEQAEWEEGLGDE